MNIHNKNIARSGFTLVELSIVIVIIGFLVAGIAAGSNMVKQAQLRSVITDIQSHQTGYNGFIGRYNKVPGDMDVAFAYWDTNCATDAGDCNGDGNGIVLAATDDTDEVAGAWRHLGLAGFLNGGNAVVPVAPAAFSTGVNVPGSKISGAGFMIVGSAEIARANTITSAATGAGSTNYLYLGKPVAAQLSLTGGSLKGEDAYNIDAKIDDGSVSGTNFVGFATGSFQAFVGDGNTADTCLDDDDGPPASYNMSTSETACSVAYALN